MTWAAVATQEELEPGRARVYEVEGIRVALCNVEGEFHAVADLCTHDGGPLGEGELFGNQIECPRHGARFDVTTGRAVVLPAVRPVKAYPTRVVDGVVEIEVG